MLKKLICGALIACMGLFGVFMVGCDDEKTDEPVQPQNCDVVLETTSYYLKEECKDFIAICNTYDEVKDLYALSGRLSFDNDIVREYIEKYSENKSLIVCVFGENSHRGQYRIKEVEVNASKLTMYIKHPLSNTANLVVNSVYLIAGVDKSFVADVTELTYVFV